MIKSLFKKNHPQSINQWKKTFSRLVSLVLIASLAWGSLGLVGQTISFFNDLETPTTSHFSASFLDLSLDKTDLGTVVLSENFDLSASSIGSLPLQYQFKIETDGHDFCADLSLTATLGSDIYTGPLNNFLSTTTIISTLSDQWQFQITDPANNPAGKTCAFNIIFHAWQTDRHIYNPNSGFTDAESIPGKVESDSGSGGPECIQVLEPNGGEVWWVGRTHKIGWTTSNPVGRDIDLTIDVYYSNDSGQSWGLIKKDLNNHGSYFWRVSLMLENNTYWVPSDTARVKLVARYPNGEICGWDMSDEDYCPPIETDLLTPEELAWLAEHDLMALADSESDEPPPSPLPSTATGFPLDDPILPLVPDSEPTITLNSGSVASVENSPDISNHQFEFIPLAELLLTATTTTDSAPILDEPIPTSDITGDQFEFIPLAEITPTTTEDIIHGETPTDQENSLEILAPDPWEYQPPPVCLSTDDPPIKEPPQIDAAAKIIKPLESVEQPEPLTAEKFE